MTRKELASVLGLKPVSFQSAINKAKSEMPEMSKKINYNPFEETSFTKEEIECICRNIDPPLNDMQIAIILDNYIEHECTHISRVSPWIDGTEEFEERSRKDSHVKACANCSYCTGKSRKGVCSKLFPYCNFYKRFIARIKVPVRHKNWQGIVVEKTRPADIFKDVCESWSRGEIRHFKKKN